MERVEIKVSKMEGSERDSLRAYLRRVPEMLETRVAKVGGQIHGQVKFEQGRGMWTSSTLPPEDDLRSFYMAFRFFYLQQEPSNFMKVAKIIGRYARHGLVIEWLARLRAQWTGALSRQQLEISVNGRPLTPALLMDLWFNAHYFHSDASKEVGLNELNSILGVGLNRFLLADAVFEATKAVGQLYEKIRTFRV